MDETITRPAQLKDVLLAWREREGLSHLQAGNRLGAWPQGYRNWEIGAFFPAPARWPAICEETGLTTDDLVRLEQAHRAQRARAAG